MNDTTYTADQLAFAERVSKAMSNVPSGKRPMLETLVEILLAGASITASPADGE